MKAEVRSLTGLRGIAATLVMLYHFNYTLLPCGGAPSGPLRQVIGHGYLMVDLFLVLSGFIMAMNYGAMFAGGRAREAYPVFLLRRVARVYPLFLFITLALLAIRLLGLDGPLDLRGMLAGPIAGRAVANLLMVQAWGIADSIAPTSWSLSAEWAAYLLFPLLCLGTLSGRPRLAVASAALAAACLGWVAATPDAVAGEACRHGPLDVWTPATVLPVLRCVACFVLGLVAFRVSGLQIVRRIASRAATGWALCGIAAALMALPGTDLPLVAVFALLIVALAHGRGGAGAVLASPLPYLLGELSYAIYLLHPCLRGVVDPVLTSLHARGHGNLAVYGTADLLGGAAVIALAFPLHRLIETPGRRMVRRLERIVRPDPAPVASGG